MTTDEQQYVTAVENLHASRSTKGITMTFDELRNKNAYRCETDFGHALTGPDAWQPTDWTNAMAGEVGEACNVSKKLKRLAMNHALNRPEDRDHSELVHRLLLEVGDAVIYADLLCRVLGASLQDAVTLAFNGKSAEIGSKVLLNNSTGIYVVSADHGMEGMAAMRFCPTLERAQEEANAIVGYTIDDWVYQEFKDSTPRWEHWPTRRTKGFAGERIVIDLEYVK